jgi:hypothetical protein
VKYNFSPELGIAFRPELRRYRSLRHDHSTGNIEWMEGSDLTLSAGVELGGRNGLTGSMAVVGALAIAIMVLISIPPMY